MNNYMNNTNNDIFTCSTADFWKSKLTGFKPGDESVLVGESTNLVHWKDKGQINKVNEDTLYTENYKCTLTCQDQ